MATAEQVKAFFEQFAPLAQANEKATGVKASVTLAQAALESGYGQSAPGNMYFGVKAGGSWNGDVQYLNTTEEVSGIKVPAVAAFRKYQSAVDSFLDHANVLKQSNYADVYKTTNPYDQVVALKAGGYATDSKYIPLVSDIITNNNLTQYDSDKGLDASGQPYTRTASDPSKIYVKAPQVDSRGTVIGATFGNAGEDPKKAYERENALNPSTPIVGDLVEGYISFVSRNAVILIIIVAIIVGAFMLLPADTRSAITSTAVKGAMV